MLPLGANKAEFVRINHPATNKDSMRFPCSLQRNLFFQQRQEVRGTCLISGYCQVKRGLAEAVEDGRVRCGCQQSLEDTVDDIDPTLRTLRTLNYANYGIFLILGIAGFIPSTVFTTRARVDL